MAFGINLALGEIMKKSCLAGSSYYALTNLCICERFQNLPNSDTEPKQIAWQRFHPANSMNRAWLHKCIPITHS